MSGSSHSIVHVTSIAARITALKNALFQALSVMQKKSHIPPALIVMGVIIKWLQMMAFLFALDWFAWESAVIEPLRVVAIIPSPAGWFQAFEPAFLQVMFYISFVWVIIFCSLMIWTVNAFLHGRIPSLAPLQVLASIGQFSATVAYIPLLTLLLSVYTCDSNPTQGAFKVANPWVGYTCYRGGHLALVVLATVFAAAFACLAALFALVFYDNHPLSSNLGAKVHGRAEFVMLVVKTVLVLGIEIFPSQINNVWAMVALNLVASVCWASSKLYYLPLINFNMNVLHMALSCIYIWGSICLAIVTASPRVQAASFLYLGAPVAVIVGVFLAHVRRRSVMSLPGYKLNSAYEVEMKARFTLQYALTKLLTQSTQQHTSAVWGEMSGLLPSQDSEETSSVASPRAVGSEQQMAHTAAGGKTGRFNHTNPGNADARSKRSGAGGESDFALFGVSFKAMDAESRERMVRDRLPSRVLNEVDHLFKDAAMRFPTSAILHMFQSRFYAVFRNDKHLATSHLLLTNRLGPSLDVAYLAFQARRAAETGAGAGVLSSAMHRLSFDKHLSDARLCTMNAAKAQLAFWQELSDPCPNLNELHRIASDLSQYTRMAEVHFKEVFLLHPQSLAAMRLFAQYNMSVANNAEKATAISAEAERMEDQKNKEQNAQKAMGGISQGFPWLEEVPMENMTDAAASMTVGATSRDLGIILSANSACARLLGYTRLQLERRNVSIIVPPPFMEEHDSYLRRYLSTGEGLFIETSTNLLGKHRLGHLVPLTLLLRESTLSDNTPVFTATLRPLNFTDQVVMMDEDWVVLGGTAGALMALQVDAATLSASEVCMADYCPMLNDTAAVAELMSKPAGNVVQMMLPGFSTASQGSVTTPASVIVSRGESAWSQQAVDVKTTLAASTVKGHTIHILTFRVLSSNEKAQRATALASRRASLALSPQPSSRMAVPMSYTSRQGEADGDEQVPPTPSHKSSLRGTPKLAGTQRSSKGTLSEQSSQDDSQHGDMPGGDDTQQEMPVGHTPITAASFAGGATCPVMSGRAAITAAEAGRASPLSSPAGLSVDQLSPRSSDSVGLHITEAKPDAPFSDKNKKSGVRIMESQIPRISIPSTPSVPVPSAPVHVNTNTTPSALPHISLPPSVTVEASTTPHGDAAAKSVCSDTDEGDMTRRTGGDGRSVRSGPSSKRSGISRGTINKLRRILSDSVATSAQEARKSIPGLTALYVTGWMLVLLIIGLGALTAALLDSNFAAYESNLKFAEIASDASQLQVQSQRRLVLRLNYKKGYVSMSPEDDAANCAEMMKLADDQTDLFRTMHQLVMGTPREAFFTEPRLTYADYMGSVPEPISRFTLAMVRDMLLGDQYWPRTMSNGDVIIGVRKQTSLNDFTSMWSGEVKEFATTNISNLTLDDHSVIFLTVNTQAGSPALEYVRSSVYESYLSTEESQQAASELVLWIFVAMGPVLSLVLVALLAPILVYIDHRRDDVMEAFLDVPNLIVMHLRSGAEKRVRALRSDDEDGEASDSDDDDEEAGRAAIAMADGQAVVDMEMEDGTVDWDAVIAMAARDEKMKSKRLGAADPKSPTTLAAKATVASAPAQLSSCCSRQQRVNPQRFYQRPMCSRGVRGPGGYYRSVRTADGSLLTFVRRDFKKSKLAVLKLGIFLVPITFMFIFFLTLYLVTLDTAAQIKALTSFSTLSSIRQSCVRTVRTNLYFMISSPAYPPSLAFRFEWTTMQIATLNMANRLLTFDMLPNPDPLDANIAPQLKYKKAPGTELTNIAGISEDMMAEVRRAQTSDACPFIAKSQFAAPGFNINACRSFNSRMLTSGLQAALRDFVVRARRLRDRRYHARIPVTTRTGEGVLVTTNTPGWAQFYNGRPITGFPDGVDFIAPGGTYVGTVAAGTSALGGGTGAADAPAIVKDGINGTLVVSITNYSVPQELAGEDWTTLFDMATHYLLPAFQQLSYKYNAAGVAQVHRYRLFIPAFVGGFLVIFAVGTFLFYLPSITRLGQDVQSKRAMLLLLPPEILSTVPSLKQMVLQVVAEHEGASSARSTTGSAGAAAGAGEDDGASVDPFAAAGADTRA